MKVFVFTKHIVVDFEDLELSTKVFANEQDALNALKEWRDDEINYVEESDWHIEADDPEHFEAYQDGCYCENHTLGRVDEQEIL